MVVGLVAGWLLFGGQDRSCRGLFVGLVEVAVLEAGRSFFLRFVVLSMFFRSESLQKSKVLLFFIVCVELHVVAIRL